jgi:hypothetical protein
MTGQPTEGPPKSVPSAGPLEPEAAPTPALATRPRFRSMGPRIRDEKLDSIIANEPKITSGRIVATSDRVLVAV